MSLPAVKALCLVLPLVSGLSFPAPEPTSNSPESSNPPPPAAPQTTPPPHLKHRRDGPVLSTYKMTEYPNMCGWEEGGVYDDYVSCYQGMTCAYQRPNEKYPGMLGCCEEGLDCSFYSTCINLSQASAVPSLTETPQPLALLCTESTAPACVTWYYSDISVTDFGCSASSEGINMLTWVEDSETTSGTLWEYDLYLTPVGTEVVDSYMATFSSDQAQNKATNAPSSTPSHSSTANSDSESTNTGAIAGGVVGGVAGVALIGAAGFFIGRKRNSKKAQGAGGTGPNDDKGPYSSVPESHSAYSENETQFASEMGTTETSQQLSEVHGSTPADRVYEMQGTTVRDTEGKHFTAELPADSEFPAKK